MTQRSSSHTARPDLTTQSYRSTVFPQSTQEQTPINNRLRLRYSGTVSSSRATKSSHDLMVIVATKLDPLYHPELLQTAHPRTTQGADADFYRATATILWYSLRPSEPRTCLNHIIPLHSHNNYSQRQLVQDSLVLVKFELNIWGQLR